MEIINVIVVKDGIVDNINSYVRKNSNDNETVEKAESDFIESIEYLFSKKLTEDEKNDLISDGYYEGYSSGFGHNYSINLCWSFCEI